MANAEASSPFPTDMDEIVVPSTPPAQPVHISNNAEMTPPPSTQPSRLNPSEIRSQSAQRTLFRRSPPLTVNSASQIAVPNPDHIAKAGPSELRTIVYDLVQALTEARMSAAHFKLQHSLLAIECKESALRAEVERLMASREVEVLLGAERLRSTFSGTPHNVQQPSAQLQIDALVRACKDLEHERDEAKSKLQNAEEIIEQEIDKSSLLEEQIVMLKTRIRDNREHFNLMRRSPHFSVLALPPDDCNPLKRKLGISFQEPARQQVNRHTQDPFAALLAADQVLNGEAATAPSTPVKSHSSRLHGHTRGAFSLSSLHTTPVQSQPVMAGGYYQSGSSNNRLAYSAPNTQSTRPLEERERRDRDSTISCSDEEALTDEDLPPSQASSLATNMLRRNPGSQGSPTVPGQAEKSSKALQTKLFGRITKAGTDRKRNASFDDMDSNKKRKLMEGIVGLGIGGWGRPSGH